MKSSSSKKQHPHTVLFLVQLVSKTAEVTKNRSRIVGTTRELSGMEKTTCSSWRVQDQWCQQKGAAAAEQMGGGLWMTAIHLPLMHHMRVTSYSAQRSEQYPTVFWYSGAWWRERDGEDLVLWPWRLGQPRGRGRQKSAGSGYLTWQKHVNPDSSSSFLQLFVQPLFSSSLPETFSILFSLNCCVPWHQRKTAEWENDPITGQREAVMDCGGGTGDVVMMLGKGGDEVASMENKNQLQAEKVEPKWPSWEIRVLV